MMRSVLYGQRIDCSQSIVEGSLEAGMIRRLKKPSVFDPVDLPS